jgi:hypothetical protein
MYFNVIKAIYDKPIANITINGEKLKPFPLMSGMRQGCSLLHSYSTYIRIPIQNNKTGRNKGIQIRMEEVKLSLFADDMILYLKDLKNSTKNLLHIINIFSNLAGCKINLQKSVALLYTNNEQTKKEYRKTIPFTIASKNKIPRNKLNKGCERPLQGKL